MRYGGAPKRDTLLQALHSMWVGRKRRLSGFVDFLLEGVTFPVGSFSSNALSFTRGLVVLLTLSFLKKCGGIVWVIRGKFLNLWLLNSEC